MHVVAGTGATEYRPTVQFVHTTLAVVVHAAALRLVPATQVVQGEQAVAPAADQLTPAVHAEHMVLDVAEHTAERKLPAVHTLEAHAAQGAKPVADQVLPLTQGAFATHASAVAFQTKAGALQAQLVWPVAVTALLVLYSSVEPQGRQAVSPATEKVCAAQAAQSVLLDGAHAEDA